MEKSVNILSVLQAAKSHTDGSIEAMAKFLEEHLAIISFPCERGGQLCDPVIQQCLEPQTTEMFDKSDPVASIWEYYKHELKKPFCTLTETRRRMIARRYAECLKLAKDDTAKANSWMEIAIEQLRDSDFHNARGKYKGQTKYNDIEHVFKSWECLEKWLNRSNGE